MDKAPQVKLHSTSHYFLDGLNDIGVEYLFSNFGTDHAPLIEEMARWKKGGRRYPKVLNCPHENTAMHMAAGFAMATGRGQAVMVHVDAGTANSAMAMHNARRGRLPLVLMAGKAPYTVRGELPGSRDNYVHFIQEPFDQAGIVRPYAKWEWTLPSGVMTKETLRRAHTVAHSDPMGPVYLMLPRETLTQTWDETAMRPFPRKRYGAVSACLQGDSVLILRQLLEALKAKATPAFRDAAAKRMEAMKREGEERRAALSKQAADKGDKGAINPHYLCAEISKAIGDDAIVVNEGIRNGPIVNNQIMRTKPGSSIGFAGGGLGSSSGTALGIKLARPEATVLQMVGDGGFYFGNPSSVYAVSKQYKLPILTMLFDNSGWSAVKEATLRVYPEGDAKATNEFNALLAPDIEFTKICEAAGGYGERVDDPEAVPAAIQRCLKEVRGGRSALMHVRIPVL